MPKIKVQIDPMGDPKMTVEGATGTQCVDLTRPLEAKLGGKVSARDYTEDYNKVSTGTSQSQAQW